MTRITVKAGAALLTGFALALLTGSPAGAAFSDDEAAPAEARYHVYGLGHRRVGESWTYLGSYDAAEDADAAGKAARNRWGESYPEWRVVKAVGLDLPPAGKCSKFLLFRFPAQEETERLQRVARPAGEFRTLSEAVAAAERIAAEGDHFEVIYFEF
jgi:hypothetical protein